MTAGRLDRGVPFAHGRNPMPRHPRLFVPRATSRVYCRVGRGEFVFDCDEEAIEFIEALRRVCQNPDARSFDGRDSAEERRELTFDEFVDRSPAGSTPGCRWTATTAISVFVSTPSTTRSPTANPPMQQRGTWHRSLRSPSGGRWLVSRGRSHATTTGAISNRN